MRREVSRSTAPSEARPAHNLIVVSVATVVTVLAVVFVVQDLMRHPLLATSLASSAFLLYYQPLNEINRFRPLVFGHVLSVGIGYLSSVLFPVPYVSAAVGLAASVSLMAVLRIVHPPAVSTSLSFSYRPHEVEAVGVFVFALLVVVLLAGLYLVLHLVVRPSRWAHLFGLAEDHG